MLFSCRTNEPVIDGAVFSKNFIQMYVWPESLQMNDKITNGEIHFSIEGTLCGQQDNGFCELADKYKDISFNRPIAMFTGIALADTIESVNLTSDTDYDDMHPAGSSLDDIIKIKYKTSEPFIKSGYKKQESAISYGYEEYLCLLKDINPKRMILVNPKDLALVFPKPISNANHNFTLTIKTTDGRECQKQFSVN